MQARRLQFGTSPTVREHGRAGSTPHHDDTILGQTAQDKRSWNDQLFPDASSSLLPAKHVPARDTFGPDAHEHGRY